MINTLSKEGLMCLQEGSIQVSLRILGLGRPGPICFANSHFSAYQSLPKDGTSKDDTGDICKTNPFPVMEVATSKYIIRNCACAITTSALRHRFSKWQIHKTSVAKFSFPRKRGRSRYRAILTYSQLHKNYFCPAADTF